MKGITMKSKQLFITLTALFFLFAFSIAGLGKEGLFYKLRLLPDAQADTTKSETASTPEGQSQAVAPEHNNNFGFGPHFTVRSLQGRYASLAGEDDNSGEGGKEFHSVCVGLVTFDGFGHFVDVETHSEDGEITHDKATGWYEVHPDGTGAMHITEFSDGTTTQTNLDVKFSFVISDGGKELIYIPEIDGVVSYAILKKQ